AGAQEEGFAALAAALAQHGERVELLLADTHSAVLDIHQEQMRQAAQLQQLHEEVRRALRRHELEHRELRPADSLSLRGEDERRLVKQLVQRYRELPAEQQSRLPALLNALGKLEMVAGDFESAQRDFQALAGLSADPGVRAEAHYHAYRAALERRQWD